MKFIYNNSYDLKNVRFGLYASTFSTVFATAILGLVNPVLMPLMIYDYYLLCAFSSQILNRTVNDLVLHNNKYQVRVNKLNYLGYET